MVKKVTFNTKPIIHVMYVWDYAYRIARKSHWEIYARDRERFKFRIQKVETILISILKKEHRHKIYKKRFTIVHEDTT